MDQDARLAMQRVMAHEAMAKLNAIAELFVPASEEGTAEEQANLLVWKMKIAEVEDWLWSKSPIA